MIVVFEPIVATQTAIVNSLMDPVNLSDAVTYGCRSTGVGDSSHILLHHQEKMRAISSVCFKIMHNKCESASIVWVYDEGEAETFYVAKTQVIATFALHSRAIVAYPAGVRKPSTVIRCAIIGHEL